MHKECPVESDILFGLLQNASEGAAANRDASKEPTAGEGPWLFSLDFPSYMPIQQHAKNRCAALHLSELEMRRFCHGGVCIAGRTCRVNGTSAMGDNPAELLMPVALCAVLC